MVCLNNYFLGSNDGFKCGRNQIHFYCMSCRSPFPDRSGANYKQRCEICNIPYCNLYFNCKSNRNPKVLEILYFYAEYLQKLYELKDHKVEDSLKPDIFRGNKYEFRALDDYLKANNMRCKDILDEINEKYVKKNNFKYIVNKYIVNNPIISNRLTF